MANNDNDDGNIDNYHRDKIHKKEIVKQKINAYLQKVQVDPRPILVPNGLQKAHTVWNLPKPLHLSLGITSTTQDVYVAHYGAGPVNGMCMWTIENGSSEIKRFRQPIKTRLTHIVFVSSRNVFFASSTDLSLRTLGNEFQMYSKLQLNHSILSMIYDDRLDGVYTGSIGLIEQWKVNKSLTDPPDRLKYAILDDPASGVKPWITFLKTFREEHKIFALTGSALYILDDKSLNQLAYIENRHTYPMTTCLGYWPRQYLITGSKDGEIKVWNMYMRSFPYVGCFRGHTSMIIYLAIHPSDNLLISASTDSTIRLWRIDTFTEMFRYGVIDSLRNVVLVNTTRLFYATSSRIQVLELNIPHTLFTLIGSKILHIQRIRSVRKPSRIFVLGEDGGARIISPVHGNILTTAFPIITHKPVSFAHNPIEEQIYVLLEDGSIMVICTETNPCKTVQLLQAFTYDDRVQSMEIVYWKNPAKNEPITGLLLVAHVDGRIRLVRGDGHAFEPVYSHRGEIEQMVACPYDPENVCHLLTFNSDLSLTAWKVGKNDLNALTLHQVKDFVFHDKVNFVTIIRNNILVAIRKRLIFVKLELLSKFNKEPSRDERHLAEINSLSSCPTLSLFASTSQDGALKIWDTDACLLREITFDSSLSAVSFANERGDILVGFQNNIQLISIIDYLPRYLLERISKDEAGQFEDDGKEYCIPFDPVLKFWYDPSRVGNLNVCESEVTFHQQPPLLCGNHVDFLDMYKDSYINNLKKTESEVISNHPSFQLCNPTTSVCKDPSAPFRQSVQKTIEVLNIIRRLDRICQNQNGKGAAIVDELMAPDAIPREKSPPIIEEQLSEIEIPDTESIDNFHPCAPDGFIPNSIIRERYEIKPPENIPLQLWDPNRKFDPVLVELEEELEYIEESEEEFDESNKREWLESDEESELTWTPLSNNRPVTKTPKETKQKEKKKVTIAEKSSPVAKQVVKEKKPPQKLVHEVKPKEKIVKKEKSKEEVIVKEADKEELLIPYPFDLYYEEYWFPKKVGFEFGAVLRVLITKLDSIPFLYLGNLLECILKTHQFSPLTGRLLDSLINALFKLLSHKEAGVRHLATKTLTSLGVNRRDIILKLVPCLSDNSEKVQDEVKSALRSLAGIIDADSLVEALREYDAYVEDPVLPDDATVLESFREMIIERRDSLKDRMAALYEKYEASSVKMSAWVDYILKPPDHGKVKRNSIKIKKKRQSLKLFSRNEYASSLTYASANKDVITPLKEGKDSTSQGTASQGRTSQGRASTALSPKSAPRSKSQSRQSNYTPSDIQNRTDNSTRNEDNLDINVEQNEFRQRGESRLGSSQTGDSHSVNKQRVKSRSLISESSRGSERRSQVSNKPKIAEQMTNSPKLTKSPEKNDIPANVDVNDKSPVFIRNENENLIHTDIIREKMSVSNPKGTPLAKSRSNLNSNHNGVTKSVLSGNLLQLFDERTIKSHSNQNIRPNRSNTRAHSISQERSDELETGIPEIVVNVSENTNLGSYPNTSQNGKHTAGLLDHRYKTKKGQNNIDSEASFETISLANMNKALYANIEDTVTKDLTKLAPNLFKKFDNTDIQKEESLKDIQIVAVKSCNTLGQDQRKLTTNVLGLEDIINSRERWQFALPEETESMAQIDEETSVIRKWNKMKKEIDQKTIDSILSLEHIAVTTAISVLRGRRKNSIYISENGILSNEVLNDMTMLLNLLAKKGIKQYASVKQMLKQIRLLNIDIQKTSSKQYMRPQLMNSSVENLLPITIRRSMVRGVEGERILSGLHVLPPIKDCSNRIDNRLNYGVKAIPERHGTKTDVPNGCTKYGKVGYQWTTLTSNYDMGVDNLFRDDVKKNAEKHDVKKRFKYNVFGKQKNDGLHIRNMGKRKTHIERVLLRDQPNTTESSKLNTRVALPKIPRDSKKYAPPPPNTAEEANRRSAVLEIYTPS